MNIYKLLDYEEEKIYEEVKIYNKIFGFLEKETSEKILNKIEQQKEVLL
jgi:hypothetical protein